MSKKQAFFGALKRFGRNLAGIAVVAGVQAGADALAGISFPAPVAPFIPLIGGPLLNAAAKFGRNLAGDSLGKVCKVV